MSQQIFMEIQPNLLVSPHHIPTNRKNFIISLSSSSIAVSLQCYHCHRLLQDDVQAQPRGVRGVDVQHVDPDGLHGHIHTATASGVGFFLSIS